MIPHGFRGWREAHASAAIPRSDDLVDPGHHHVATDKAMSLARRLHGLALALGAALAVALAGAPADAVEAPPGSKNFTPPIDVPNYFSNESGPFQGGANTRNAPSDTAPVIAAPASRGGAVAASRRDSRRHAARGRGRTRLAHGKAAAHRQFAHAGAPHRGRPSSSKTAHAQVGPASGKAVAAKSRAAASKGKRIAAAHG
jgi:hypothetical protein